ncbi:major facilitator superfamily domain-containing protein [Gilbertella persicaria]|uniref:major facilitator superfamily domain-containing protein n=1 Tax=Gilbertella persicaria TaxID=101096 RepID=UPI00221ECA50|nr:major facilitator superfamily domain-containing protein [Gilbertella persicaria]KAI8075346.1 major facilitator superfamily domain-containing protein [Gilbertella persicaria]
MTFVLNMDRTNISNAISDNLAADLGFTNDGVNTGTLVYSFIFTLFTLPSNAIVKRVGAHRWIPILMTSWAIVTWAHVLIHNFGGFMAVRIFIAVTEAGFIPACLTYLTGWYKTKELATRLAWFWGIQAFASAFSGLISSGIFQLKGIAGLEGWKWLFLIDGIMTHLVGFMAFFYLPADPLKTAGGLRGKNGWLTESQQKIAITRLIRDDLTKKEQNRPVNWTDAKQALLDTKLWTHLIITFVGMMTLTPIQNYLPTMIKNSGFTVTESNLLTAPSYIIGLIFSIIIARSSDRYGYVALHALIGTLWAMAGFIALELLPDNTNRWSLYVAALFTASYPSWHGMQIAWMSSNLAPIGKRTLALGAVIGAANICGVPGSQIYRVSDAPRYRYGNKINIALQAITAFMFLAQFARYVITNRIRSKKWNSMTKEEQQVYHETTKDVGSDRLDFRFRL